MKTCSTLRLPSLLGCVCLSPFIYAQNPIPNPGFEQWVGGDPVGWTTNNNQFTGQPVSQNATGHAGSTAGRGTYLGLISAPIINTIDASSQPLAISGTYQRLSFYYQLQLASTEGVEVFSAGAVFTNAGGTTVGQAFRLFDRTANTGTWTFAELPVTYNGADPTGVNVNFMLNGPAAVVGSYFVVDDVTLDNGANGIVELDRSAQLGAAWPVPANSSLNLPFEISTTTAVTIDVLDAMGRMVESAHIGTLPAGRYKHVFNVEGWNAGAYTMVLHTEQGKHTRSVVVGH